MPADGAVEVAMAGRSNSGKSSLLNRLAGQRLAHVSGTPGRTRRLHFYRMDGWYLVDLPGFGYARVGRAEREAFGEAVERYLTARSALIGAILIQDVRRDPGEEERLLVEWAAARNVWLWVAANKVDKLNRRERQEREAALTAAYPGPVFLLSARTGEGVDRLAGELRKLGLTPPPAAKGIWSGGQSPGGAATAPAAGPGGAGSRPAGKGSRRGR
ncbi:putative GTP-binding protein EngB [Candidatus Hydrogenisulfobacillus filiaventi]|uniref:Probable GTP-binding protein EngB n=1 Tax=Candidatus Hydrogenisulfobacillus filiaventi TaxID=2707344 RepID=A0A6F8ZIC1_9FIRM|nr:putative GTP-binding protein EngB [Candidatus Hydrogenisulfobacillus filiaventi]